MKKKLILTLCLLLAAATFACAFALDLNIPSLSDMLVRHRVFRTAQEASYAEYIVVFYRDSDNVLKQLNDEVVFYKNAGVTLEDLQSFDIESLYPGFHGMRFASLDLIDNGDSYSMVVCFSNLDDPDNLRQAIDSEIVVAEARGVYMDAGSICDDCIAKGFQELDMIGYSGLSLHFDVK